MKTFANVKYPAVIALTCLVSACSSNPKIAEPTLGAAVSAPAYAEPVIVNTPRGPSLVLNNVLFDFEQSSLRPEASVTVIKAVAYLKDNPERNALIEGHTDTSGDAQYNLDLSLKRSEAIKTALVNEGISVSRVKTFGFGETMPSADNSNLTGRQSNRRVEIIFHVAD